MGYGQNSIDLDKMNQFFFDMDDDPSKAALLWYLNSGYGRFQAHKEYDKSHNCEEVDQQAIVKEIANESMTNKERAERVKKYFCHHANGVNLFACGICGIREMGPPSCKYTATSLAELDLLTYDIDQQRELELQE